MTPLREFALMSSTIFISR